MAITMEPFSLADTVTSDEEQIIFMQISFYSGINCKWESCVKEN
jgi:hypothetical protein